MGYSIVTPARNEAENLRRVASCLAAQTVLPKTWVIVDNGSSDETHAVASELAHLHPWIQVLEIPGTAEPSRGGQIVRAFQAGLERLSGTEEVVVKLDADVTFDATYFERLLSEFAADPALGMASGEGHQLERGRWRIHRVTDDHVWGPARAYRRTCLADVLPLEESLGWDAVDEVKARLAGWTTRNIPGLEFRHHRQLGLRDGTRRRQWARQGRAAYFIGYRPSYLLFRAIFRSREERWAIAMVGGYLAAAATRAPRCEHRGVRAYVRRRQRFRNVGGRVIDVTGVPLRRWSVRHR